MSLLKDEDDYMIILGRFYVQILTRNACSDTYRTSIFSLVYRRAELRFVILVQKLTECQTAPTHTRTLRLREMRTLFQSCIGPTWHASGEAFIVCDLVVMTTKVADIDSFCPTGESIPSRILLCVYSLASSQNGSV